MGDGAYRWLVSAQINPRDIIEDDSEGSSQVSRLDVDVHDGVEGCFLSLRHQSPLLWKG